MVLTVPEGEEMPQGAVHLVWHIVKCELNDNG